MPWTVPSSPGRAVERVEDDVGLELGEARGDVAVHVELGDVRPAALAQRRGDALAAGQRDFALGRPAAHQDDDVEIPVHSPPHPLDFPFEADVGFRLDPAPDFLAQRLDLGACRATEIEQEIAMLFRDLGIAHRQAAAARRVDQRPGLVARRVLEGRAAGAAAQRLRFLAGAGDARPSPRRSPRDRRARRGRSLR